MKKDERFIKGCPACEDAVMCGLTFEETHSSPKKGFLLVETDEGQELIPSPHREIKRR